MLRYSKLTVADEIENALSYYRITFLRELPRAVRRHRRRDSPRSIGAAGRATCRRFLQMGSWIGGDRDGNPNVNAATMQTRLTRQSTTIFDFYLEEVHALAPNCRCRPCSVASSPALQALADASPDQSPHRTDEPYRRALIGIYARLAATARELGAAQRPAQGSRPADAVRRRRRIRAPTCRC